MSGEGAAPGLSLRGLVKRFGTRRALCGVDLDLHGAQLVGVVGPDGAGKTTLLRAVAGLLEVEAERAEVLGVDLRGDVGPLKARLGYVPQVWSLQRELSVFENLAFTAQVPPGAKRVEISAPKVVRKIKMYDTPDSPVVEETAELLPARYNVRSDLTMTVQRGSQEKRFELTSK